LWFFSPSNSVNIIEIESTTSSSNQSSDSSDLDDTTLSRINKISKTPQKVAKSVPKKIDLVNQQPPKPSQKNNPEPSVGTKGVSQNHLLCFDNNKVLKIINWIC